MYRSISDVYIHTNLYLWKKHILHIPLGNTFCFASLRIGNEGCISSMRSSFQRSRLECLHRPAGWNNKWLVVGSPTHLKHMRTVKLDHETPIRGEHEKKLFESFTTKSNKLQTAKVERIGSKSVWPPALARSSGESPRSFLVGGWTNPSEKYARQNGFIFPKFRGENKTNNWSFTT